MYGLGGVMKDYFRGQSLGPSPKLNPSPNPKPQIP